MKNKELLQKIASDNNWELDYLTDGSPIFQSKELYTFTSDSVLLGKYVDENEIETLVDFCSGSGIVGLEVVGRIPVKKLYQFEIQRELAILAGESSKYNKSKTEIQVINDSLSNASSYVTGADCIVCNPPYFKLGSGKVNQSSSKSLARHELSITLEDIFTSATKILKTGGSIYFIHIKEREAEMEKLAKKYNFKEIKKKVFEGKKLVRFLVKYVKIWLKIQLKIID